MARFDVHRLARSRSRLVVDVQADVLSHLDSRVVVPLMTASAGRRQDLPGLKPVITVEGDAYAFVATDITAVLTRQLGERVVNIESDHRDEITRALDLLFTGF